MYGVLREGIQRIQTRGEATMIPSTHPLIEIAAGLNDEESIVNNVEYLRGQSELICEYLGEPLGDGGPERIEEAIIALVKSNAT